MDGVRAGSLVIGEDELVERFSRSSGPGGQSVNTADSRVELRWDIAASAVVSDWQRDRLLERLVGRTTGGVLAVAASEYRSQLQNRVAARTRMAAIVAEALAPPPPPRRPTKPGRGARERRLTAKRRRADTKRSRGRPGSED